MNFHIPPFRQREKGWAERRCPPAAPVLRQGLGLERRFWAVPSPSACPFWHGCQGGREGAEKAEQEKRSQSHRGSALVPAQKKKEKLPNPHGVCERRSLFGVRPFAQRAKEKWRQISEFWPTRQRGGSSHMNCRFLRHVAVGFLFFIFVKLQARIEEWKQILTCLVCWFDNFTSDIPKALSEQIRLRLLPVTGQ